MRIQLTIEVEAANGAEQIGAAAIGDGTLLKRLAEFLALLKSVGDSHDARRRAANPDLPDAIP